MLFCSSHSRAVVACSVPDSSWDLKPIHSMWCSMAIVLGYSSHDVKPKCSALWLHAKLVATSQVLCFWFLLWLVFSKMEYLGGGEDGRESIPSLPFFLPPSSLPLSLSPSLPTTQGLLVTRCDNNTLYLWSLRDKEPQKLHQMEFQRERWILNV